MPWCWGASVTNESAPNFLSANLSNHIFYLMDFLNPQLFKLASDCFLLDKYSSLLLCVFFIMNLGANELP